MGEFTTVKATTGAKVKIQADKGKNLVVGAVFAQDKETKIDLIGTSNILNSSAVISEAGGLTYTNVISSLYAEQGASISLEGAQNTVRTYAVSSSDDLERVVWAYNGYADDYIGERVGSEITIKGNVQIKTDSYDDSFIGDSKNSKDVSIAAGTGTNLTSKKVLASSDMNNDERAQVNITYSNVSDKKDPSFDVEGDILSAYEGLVNINAADDNAGINVKN